MAAEQSISVRELRRGWGSVVQHRQGPGPSDRRAAATGDRSDRDERHHGKRFPNFHRFVRVFKRLSAEPSPARFEDNVNFIVHKLQRGANARIALSSLAPVGEDPNSRHPVQAWLNELIDTYNSIIRRVASTACADFIPFGEAFHDQLVIARTAKPFTHFSFADRIARDNGWQFHIDGIHLNTNGGRILTEAIQQFLDAQAFCDV